MTPAVELQMVLPDSKPGLRSSCDAVQPPLDGLIVQVKLADPDALVVSVAVTVTDEVPAVPVWLRGLVTVTVLPPTGLIVQVKLADPDALVVSVAVTVTDEVPAVVGVPEIRPVAV